MNIRAAAASDAAAIAAIYNHYVLATAITFEEQAVSDADMAARIGDVAAAGLPWLVAEREGRVIGYAYATKWRARPAYRYSVEVSVYTDAQAGVRGAGSALYEALFAELRARSVHVAIGGIALPNEKSVALHEKFGMRKVAHFSEVGYKFGRWLDVGYWQAVLS
ncbi:MAG TPA: arsinothricin resistance N-acetyltransferase ArsN1 family B [Paucimonas sp.]|nr:arsinothricin resistance N-acetyltransferase ArsN1 family B [Paucimonas sp.]